MSAMKAYMMSDVGVQAAQRALDMAEARWAAQCAACALAAPYVDAATLDMLTFHAARELGEAHEHLAVCLGYDGAADMVR